jgi:hypothetical protein
MPLFGEMIRDAAQTCIQGDSHRMLMFLLVSTHDPPYDALFD